MARSIHIRLDDSAAAALEVVRAETASDSDAVRTALREAASRRRQRSSLRAEVEALAADPQDVVEKREILDLMEALAPDLGDES